jgi:hypothetical protein
MTNWEAPLNPGSYTQYLICLSNYSSAVTTVPLSFGGTAVVSCSPLGTEVVQLSGNDEPGYNVLEWTSSSEFNADKYLIERSEDGVHYTEIGTLEAHGLSIDELTYRFEDLQPASNMTYYRVKLVRTNNTSTTSNTLAIEQEFMKEVEIVKAHPNPASDKLNVVLSSQSDAHYQLTLSSLSGQKVFDTNLAVQKGLTHTFIDVNAFRNGFYLLTVSQNGKTISTNKIVIE